jgi:hypothetical protein
MADRRFASNASVEDQTVATWQARLSFVTDYDRDYGPSCRAFCFMEIKAAGQTRGSQQLLLTAENL